MESLLVTLIGGALGGLIYALAVALDERRKNINSKMFKIDYNH